MSERARILLVDDEAGLSEEVVRGLARYGYEVTAADGATAAEEALEQNQFDLVLLDINMPERDGWSVLPQLVREWSVPVIILTANADLSTRLRSFTEGAVDYLSKPFFIEELVARIRTRLRAEAHQSHRTEIRFGDCRIDLDARLLQCGDKEIALTPTEFDILTYMALRPGRAVTRAMLADHAMPESGERFDRTVDSHVSRIRSKLGPAGSAIQTVWGIGWRFEPGATE